MLFDQKPPEPDADRLALVPFEGHQILTVAQTDGVFVVMKPIVAALGLQWEAQFKRIKRHAALSKGMSLMDIPSAGGQQQAVSLRLEQFHGWLVTLTPDRVRDPVRREIIVRYQERAFRAVFDHFHGKPAAAVTLPVAQPVSARIALQNQVLKLTRQLQKTYDRGERRIVHSMVDGMCQDLGIATPALDTLGRDAPEVPDILTGFWAALEQVQAAGAILDHSHKPTLLAFSPKEVQTAFEETGINIPFDLPLRRALRASRVPAFVAVKTVNSRIFSGHKNCWVFQIQP
jgi:hypothetical protein